MLLTVAMVDVVQSNSIDPLALFGLAGKVAVVTGASSGIGERAARVLSALGARVALAARRTDRLRVLADQLGDAAGFTCDVGVSGSSDQLVADVIERFGHVDIVFAAAGVTTRATALKETPEQFRDVNAVNLFGPFELARAVAVHLRTRGAPGSIIFVSSCAAFRSFSDGPAAGYVASKSGLVGLTHELALQWARYGIRVNALVPGFYPSEMTPAPPTNEMADWYRSRVPLGRLAHRDELDGAIAYLASDASSYMTGHSLAVDGRVAL
ncbi:MAG: short-chain dehydrogenase/reductase [Acidimicrobiales bacterium]|nr:short-chain dehydrogenase/reductase [Acidimicrobiales bacterium]